MIRTIKNKVVFFDLETTGLDVAQDRICSIAIKVYKPDLTEVIYDYYSLINPQMEIPTDASDIHGITNTMVQDAPTFAEAAKIIQHLFTDSVIVGYNIMQFDLAMLQQEFKRNGLVGILECEYVDAAVIFKRKEERTLSAALKFFCNQEMQDAHNAQADVDATVDVFKAQLSRYSDLAQMPVEELQKYSNYDKGIVDFAGKLALNDSGEVIYNFGKSKGKRVIDDPGFGEWMLKQDFITEDTKNNLRVILYRNNQPFDI